MSNVTIYKKPARPPTLLFLEDDRYLLETFGLLAEIGYQVIAVDQPEDALEKIRGSREIDLLSTDLELGSDKIDGLDIAEEMRRLRPDVPLLMITGSDPGDTRIRRFLDFENAQLFEKPFKLSDLEKTLNSLIGKKDFKVIEQK